MHIERLFIGGVLDGQYRAVPEEWIVVAEPIRENKTDENHPETVIGTDVKVHRYLLLPFDIEKSPGQTYELACFVIDTMPKEEANKSETLRNKKLRVKP